MLVPTIPLKWRNGRKGSFCNFSLHLPLHFPRCNGLRQGRPFTTGTQSCSGWVSTVIKSMRWAHLSPAAEVLVHEGTVEEEMSRHRTQSVLGVEYERVKASSLVTSPGSVLGYSSDFFPVRRAGVGGIEEYQSILEDNLHRCVDLSTRVADSLPQRLQHKDRKAGSIEDVRRWLQNKSEEEAEEASKEGSVTKYLADFGLNTKDQ